MSIRNQHLKKALISLGCVPRKSLVLKFPTFEQVPKEYIIPFIRGYVDGDGCISYKRRKTSLGVIIRIEGTLDFLKGVEQELEVGSGVFVCHPHHCTLEYSSTKSFEIIKKLYLNSKIHLNRKYNRAMIFIKNNNAVKESDLPDY